MNSNDAITITYQAGDEIVVGDATITLCSRKGNSGIRWTWLDRDADVMGEGYKATPELAIADAAQTLGAPTCRHGWPATMFCTRCHDGQ